MNFVLPFFVIYNIKFCFQYKDAFLNANPDFKWYKLPAPPLRTLSTRPSNKKIEASSSDQQLNLNNDDQDFTEIERNDEEAIQPGKLADESQIGGLSSLFTPQKIQDNNESSDYAELINGEHANSKVPKPPKKRYSELPLDINKKDCKADLFGDRKNNRKESNNNQLNMVKTKY